MYTYSVERMAKAHMERWRLRLLQMESWSLSLMLMGRCSYMTLKCLGSSDCMRVSRWFSIQRLSSQVTTAASCSQSVQAEISLLFCWKVKLLLPPWRATILTPKALSCKRTNQWFWSLTMKLTLIISWLKKSTAASRTKEMKYHWECRTGILSWSLPARSTRVQVPLHFKTPLVLAHKVVRLWSGTVTSVLRTPIGTT